MKKFRVKIKSFLRSSRTFFIKLGMFMQTKRFKFIFSLSLIAISLALLVTVYYGSIIRLWDSICDFGASIGLYFGRLFGFEVDASSVTEIPDVDLQHYVWFDIEALKQKFSDFPDLLFNKSIFSDYNMFLFKMLYNICFILLGCLLLVFVPILVKHIVIQKNDKKAGDVSKAYKLYCSFLERFLYPSFRYIKGLFRFTLDKKFIRYALIITWIFAANLPTIAIGIFGYYFYFLATFDILSLFNQIIKLFIDLIITFWTFPLIVWLAAFVVVCVVIAFYKAYDKLRHMEAMNCGFLKIMSYIILIKGEPGLGKTTLATDFALSWENIYKEDALEIMMAMEMLFPAFSFQSLRVALNEAIDDRRIFCTPAADTFVDSLLIESPAPYLYNTKIFATERNTGTSCVTLETAIKTYAKAYFIYANDNSTMSNYPIRFDGKFDDSKHLKKWDGDFFKRKAIGAEQKSRYAHILDQDVLRPGKKIDPDNRFNGTFGYGIYVNTEWGKSRGNKLTTDDVKKSDETTNQKNDLYSYSLKMCRHVNSTIWHKVFFRFIGDEQRPESLSADQRELCSIIDIVDKSEIKLVLPFAGLIDKTYDSIYKPFVKFYKDYLNKRSDVILSVQLVKFGVSLLSRIYSYLYNTFGYYEMTLSVERGSDYGKDGKSEPKLQIYYLMCKKIYSDRYNTDCHSAYFTKEQLAAGLGILDYPTYAGRRMSPEEMAAQHDYFIMEMTSILNYDDNVNKSEASASKSAKKEKRETVVFSFDDI